MCSYNNPGVNRAVKRRPELTDAQELANRISERRRWIRSEQAKKFPNTAAIARYQAQIDSFSAEREAISTTTKA
jgi:hypothetical protein